MHHSYQVHSILKQGVHIESIAAYGEGSVDYDAYSNGSEIIISYNFQITMLYWVHGVGS